VILGVNPGFAHFKDICLVLGFGSISPEKRANKSHSKYIYEPHRHHLNLSPLSIYPIRGGGDYRGIYDIGFKRGFMGYIGLLLNAPYKIDRMVWMRLGYRSLLSVIITRFV
jgi:hypothetical protein